MPKCVVLKRGHGAQVERCAGGVEESGVPFFREQHGRDLAKQLLANSGLTSYVTSYLDNALFSCVMMQRGPLITDADCVAELWPILSHGRGGSGYVRALLIAMSRVRFACTWRVLDDDDEPVYTLICPFCTHSGSSGMIAKIAGRSQIICPDRIYCAS